MNFVKETLFPFSISFIEFSDKSQCRATSAVVNPFSMRIFLKLVPRFFNTSARNESVIFINSRLILLKQNRLLVKKGGEFETAKEQPELFEHKPYIPSSPLGDVLISFGSFDTPRR